MPRVSRAQNPYRHGIAFTTADDGRGDAALPRMKRCSMVCALVLAAASSAASAASAPRGWLQNAARKAASSLSDGTVSASITYVAPRSRFPRVVLTGSFICKTCSHLRDKAAPVTGKVAELRYDGRTHQSRDFALCSSRADCDVGLCGGGCTRSRDVLDAAFSALYDRMKGVPGDPVPFSQEVGTSRCHIRYPVREPRYVAGVCTTALRLLGRHDAVVRFTERWAREYRGRRWVDIPTRTHTWRVFETHDGWKTQITSTGDPPPQLRRS